MLCAEAIKTAKLKTITTKHLGLRTIELERCNKRFFLALSAQCASALFLFTQQTLIPQLTGQQPTDTSAPHASSASLFHLISHNVPLTQIERLIQPSLESVSRDLNGHADQIYTKIVDIMKDLFAKCASSLERYHLPSSL